MIKSSTLAAAATLAMAAIPMLALATNANAAPAVTVQVADLDTLTPAGAQAYAQRVDDAADRFCRQANPNMRLTERAYCVSAVKAEMADKFEARNAVLAAKAAPQVASR
jgi:UrcA family protein